MTHDKILVATVTSSLLAAACGGGEAGRTSVQLRVDGTQAETVAVDGSLVTAAMITVEQIYLQPRDGADDGRVTILAEPRRS